MAPRLQTAERAARGKLPTDVWWHTIVPTSSRERTGYPTQKTAWDRAPDRGRVVASRRARRGLVRRERNDAPPPLSSGGGSCSSTDQPAAIEVMRSRLAAVPGLRVITPLMRWRSSKPLAMIRPLNLVGPLAMISAGHLGRAASTSYSLRNRSRRGRGALR